MTPEQLKASILQRAMEGKLVPQNPNDEPASELLKRIKAEKEKLISEGKIKRDKKETEIFRGDDGKHYEKFADGSIKEFKHNIPKGWAIFYLPDICALEDGSIKRGPFGSSITKSMFVPKGEHTYKVYEQGNAIRKTIDYGDYWLKESDYIRLKNFSIKAGDILISCAGTIGEIFQIPSNYYNGVINQALLKLTLNSDIIDSQYFKWMFTSLINTLKEHSIGSAIKNLASIKFLKYEVPMLLPPLAEQQRIVEVIESALEKVDEYAESYNQLQKLDKIFPDKLKKSILQYAMQGKLVEQDPNDEPVEVLLEKIRAEKQKLFEEGKIKKKDLKISIVSQGDDNSYYEEVPNTWQLFKLKNLLQLDNGTKQQNERLIYWDVKTLRGIKDAEFKEKGNKVHSKDTVILVDGENSGELFIIPHDGYMGSTFKKIHYLEAGSKKYIDLYIDSKKELLKNSKTGSAIPHLNKTLFKELIVALPPIQEQKRISSKITQIFSQINRLI